MTRLKFQRRQMGFTQTVLAFYSGLTQGDVSLIERRLLTPTAEQVQRLSDAVGVPPDELFDDVEEEEVGQYDGWRRPRRKALD